ncbi:MAG: DUF5716 family protein [Lachnospiraceae bacterium]|nr:DUF5716 family protein [Lachnospiraceae bacterium]MCM1303803.1 DUF5716 family protein [Butyrivibrio sp.]MCM1342845.1 DUF5716 family protein [Muribaculaceae bacterium]MCM1410472.1 DUF5716 family protein [Lachnospiraceae bacterium]
MGILKNDKLIVGYDLGNRFSQISYALSADGEAETLSQVAGAQMYNVPTVLCKRTGVNQWFYGREALRNAAEEQGILVENLVQLALDGEPILIEEDSYDPVSLLTLFFKRSLGMLSQAGTSEKLGALMITCEQLDHRMIQLLNEVLEGLRLKTEKICFQSHTESFFHYMIRQPGELRTARAMLYDYREDRIRIYAMDCNRRTTPIVAYIEESEADFPVWYTEGGDAQMLSEAYRQALDRAFLRLAEISFDSRAVSSVYLIGDGFSEEWMKGSLRFLCRGRRVFQGNNLFSKGACYGMQERIHVSQTGREYLFLGNDKLKANVGMDVMRQGEASYLALLDAGVNWYEADQITEFYLQEGNQIDLKITPLIGKNIRTARITLENLPPGISRIRARLYLEAENRLAVEIEDLGLGELRLPSGKSWRETIELY